MPAMTMSSAWVAGRLLVFGGRPAHADAAKYLRLLDDKYGYISEQQAWAI
jgi:hypothetical protein